MSGKVALWIVFPEVFVEKAGKTGKAGSGKKKKKSVPQFFDQIEVRPRSEVLEQLQGRCDRILVGAEFPCLDDKDKEIMISNSVGEEWGDTSMLGLKPANLFVRLEDVRKFERKHKIQPEVEAEPEGREEPTGVQTGPGNDPGHPCFAPELQVAGQCWQALFADEGAARTGIKKGDILAWLCGNHPELSKAAMERIALVVTPGKGSGR